MYLTKRQKQVLDYIESFIREKGYSPSLDEIGKGLNLSSLATVHKHLANLQTKGFMRRLPNRSRSIELEKGVGYGGSSEVKKLRLLGEIAAGLPIEAYADSEHSEEIDVPMELTSGKDNYVLRVRGDSMIDESIADGDYLICESRATAENGQTVVALVSGHEATVKKFYRENGKIRLQPANPTMTARIYDSNDVAVQGLVVGLMRKY